MANIYDASGRESARIGKRVHRRTKEVSFLYDPLSHSFELAGLTEVLQQATLLQEEIEYSIRIVSYGHSSSSQHPGSPTADSELCNFKSFVSDILVIATNPVAVSCPEVRNRYLEHIRQVCIRSHRVVSMAAGTMLLAATGLLDGRRATIHWEMRECLQRMYPRVLSQADTLFTEEGNIYTCAGATGVLDLALRLVEIDCGRSIAAEIASKLLLHQRRSGDASQVSLTLRAQSTAMSPLCGLLEWLPEHLVEDLSIEKLARRVAMSPRNFARTFRQQVGMTPGRYVETLRFQVAQRELRESRQSVARAAASSGFDNPEALRRVFVRRLGLTPARYRSVESMRKR